MGMEEEGRIKDWECKDGNLRSLFGIRRMDRKLNARLRKLCSVKNKMDESINKRVLLWSGHFERMENRRIVRRVNEGGIYKMSFSGSTEKKLD